MKIDFNNRYQMLLTVPNKLIKYNLNQSFEEKLPYF